MDRLKYTYEGKVTLLMMWIKNQREEFSKRNFPNTLEGAHEMSLDLVKFRQQELVLRYE